MILTIEKVKWSAIALRSLYNHGKGTTGSQWIKRLCGSQCQTKGLDRQLLLVLLGVEPKFLCGSSMYPWHRTKYSVPLPAPYKQKMHVWKQLCMDMTVITQLYSQLHVICQLHVSTNTIFGLHQLGYNYRRKLHNIQGYSKWLSEF